MYFSNTQKIITSSKIKWGHMLQNKNKQVIDKSKILKQASDQY